MSGEETYGFHADDGKEKTDTARCRIAQRGWDGMEDFFPPFEDREDQKDDSCTKAGSQHCLPGEACVADSAIGKKAAKDKLGATTKG